MSISVYTAIFGGYDTLMRVIHRNSTVRCVCFSDRRLSRVKGWSRKIVVRTEKTPSLDNRKFKTLSHQLFFGDDYTVYHDGNVRLRNDPANLVTSLVKEFGEADLYVFRHPHRRTVSQELGHVLRLKLITEREAELVRELYKEAEIDINTCPLLMGRCLIRTPEAAKFNVEWWKMIQLVRRDQLTLTLAAARSQVKLAIIPRSRIRRHLRVHRHRRRRVTSVEDHKGEFMRLRDEIVSPISSKGSVRWQGHCSKKPWAYRVTALIPHIETPEPLEVVVACLQAQTEKPFISIVDTGSLTVARERVERLRAESCEIHYIVGHGYEHGSQVISAAMDLGLSLCRTEYLYCTHSDVFPMRQDLLEYLMSICNANTPVVGYHMSPRDGTTDQWRGMVSHACTMLHAPTIFRLGATWALQRAFNQFGVDYLSGRCGTWPDTETAFNLCLRRVGLTPRFIGYEENYVEAKDENIHHVRSYSGSQLYGGDYAAKAAVWMVQALVDAKARIAVWTEPQISKS